MNMKKRKAYLATPIGKIESVERSNAEDAAKIISACGYEVYKPWEHVIDHAWEYPNNEWALMVFENDIAAIRDADIVIVLSYGRTKTTSGTNWEAGYAYGIGKKVVVVEMIDNEIMSLMVANGRYSTVKGIDNLPVAISNYEEMPQLRTDTEQK